MIQKSLSILLVFVFCLTVSAPVSAEAPYTTFTLGKHDQPVYTQTAYRPIAVLDGYSLGTSGKSVPFSLPEDLFIRNGKIYIADSGNSRIVVLDTWGRFLLVVGKDILEHPTGVFVDEQGNIYAADPRASKVFKFDANGKLMKTYGKPDSILFGEDESFKPLKVILDKSGNLYIVGEGMVQGLIQLAPNGNFLGFFGGNRSGFDLMRALKRTFYTDKQMKKLMEKLPASVTNVAVDDLGLVYTVTTGEEIAVRLKKLNISGDNLLESVFTTPHIADITVGKSGNIYVVDSRRGYVMEYDRNGRLLFAFGGPDTGNLRLGLFKSPSGIAVTQDGRLLVLDKKRGIIQMFKPTEFASLVHEALRLFQDGKYLQSERPWRAVLRLNSMFSIAHTGLGMVAFKKGDYEQAAAQFRLAGNREKYSEAYWEVRRAWLMKYATWVMIGLLALFTGIGIIRKLHEKYGFGRAVVEKYKSFNARRSVKQMLHVFRMLRHPLDGYYELESEGRASVGSASILLVLLFFVHLFKLYKTNFIFSDVEANDISIIAEFYKIYIPVFTWMICNYFVSTINDGEGKFKNVYKGTVYALSPYLVFTVPLTIVSNGLTELEQVIYHYAQAGIYIWCGLLLFLMVKEIHGYEVKGTVKNIFVTMFGMLTVAAIAFILFGLSNQVIHFVEAIYEEVKLRVS
ncbi:MAG TPA: YIP1 family protein [Bacillales bacterium]|nr:YIP1 family protein [Bacillales bacterium]